MTLAAEKPVLTREDIWRTLGYTPTPVQREILDDLHSTQLVAGGYRGGKSRTASMKGTLATMAFIATYREKAVGQVAWLVGAEYEACRAEFMHPDGSLAVDLQRLWPGVTYTANINPGEIKVPVYDAAGKRLGDFTIKTKSADDPTSIGMESPVWIICCEAARVSHDIYLRLFSRVAEAKKRFPEFGFLHLEGTFEGSLGWYASLWNRWQSPAIQAQDNAKSFSLPTHSNNVLFPLGEDDPGILELKAMLPEPLFMERHMGVPVPPTGRVHAAFDPTVHIRKVKYDPSKPLYIGIDPGYSGQPSTYAVEACQLHEFESGFQQWRIIDEIRMNKHSNPGFATKDVVQEAMGRWWWKNPDKRLVIDIAGRQHNATSEESNHEIWRKMTGIPLMDQQVSIEGGIDRFDTCLKQNPLPGDAEGEPGLLIDPRCQLIISELGGGANPFDGQTHVYRWKTNQQGDIVGKTPEDKYCDGIKAFTYLAVSVMGYAFSNNARKTIRVKSRRRRQKGL